ncbi:hypothetical protein FOS14_20970 [Skermania sp. ID1734]|uniref:hypothetical protein n=1 Tax=Skermania sp. ID1734 TaxID=2597516 RepID=UPI00117F5A20|nr:hypothetical protein [Skermania sp. ID1734]TSD94232.1 hypothetical protein FOS14_20970 [Skermania sp. ID1734]
MVGRGSSELVVAGQLLVRVASTATPVAVRKNARDLVLAATQRKQSADEGSQDEPAPLRYRLCGRGELRGDRDRVTFEKLHSVLEPLASPRADQDDEPDSHCTSQRRADALTDVLDTQLGGRSGSGLECAGAS